MRRFSLVKLHRRHLGDRLLLFDHTALHLAHHMHFARLAVKAQREFFAAVDQGQRLGLNRAVYAGDAFGLLRAQAQRKAHAVLGSVVPLCSHGGHRHGGR